MTVECDHKGHKVVCPSSAGPCCEGCGEPWPYEKSEVKNEITFLKISENLREYTEIDQGEGANPEVIKAAFDACDTIKSLALHNEKLAIDAKRYQYLRDNHARVWSGVGGEGYSVDIAFEGNGDDLSSAIDEAIKFEGY